MKYLHCYYDMAVSPCSFDFFTFFMQCEIARIRRNLDYIFLHFIKGPRNEFREDNIRSDIQNLTFFENVIIPGLSIIRSCKKFEWVDRDEISGMPSDPSLIFPRGYSLEKPVADYVGNDFVLSRVRGDLPGFFQAPVFAQNFASQWMSRFDGKKIITLTMREVDRDDVGGTRSVDIEKWEIFFELLKKKGVEPVVIRDTSHAFHGVKIFKNATECPEASLSVPFRLAIYELSEYNYFKNNGPLILANFGNSLSVSFQKFDNNVKALSEDWFRTLLGMKENCSYPMTRKKMKYVWKDEDVNLFDQLFVNRTEQKSDNLNDFYDLEHLAITLEVAIKKFLSNLSQSVLLDEDLKFLSKMEEVRVKFPNIKQPDILQVIKDNQSQMFEPDLYNKLSKNLSKA